MGCECGMNCPECEDCGIHECQCECFEIELLEDDGLELDEQDIF